MTESMTKSIVRQLLKTVNASVDRVFLRRTVRTYRSRQCATPLKLQAPKRLRRMAPSQCRIATRWRMNLNTYIEQKRNEHLNDLFELLRIPSVSAQTQHKQDIERGAQWVADRLRRAGLDNVEIVSTKMHPLVYGESLHAQTKPTVFFYGHYDVQPPEPLELWTSPPFTPTVRDNILYARGAVDDNGQVHGRLAAMT